MSIDQSVRNALVKWDLPDQVTLRLINVAENRTCKVEDSRSFRSILRLHRQGYRTRQAIESELAWMQALRCYAGLKTGNHR